MWSRVDEGVGTNAAGDILKDMLRLQILYDVEVPLGFKKVEYRYFVSLCLAPSCDELR